MFHNQWKNDELVQEETDSVWITEEYDGGNSSSAQNSSLSIKDNVIATTWKDGPYLLVVKILPSKPNISWSLSGEMLTIDAVFIIIITVFGFFFFEWVAKWNMIMVVEVPIRWSHFPPGK